MAREHTTRAWTRGTAKEEHCTTIKVYFAYQPLLGAGPSALSFDNNAITQTSYSSVWRRLEFASGTAFPNRSELPP